MGVKRFTDSRYLKVLQGCLAIVHSSKPVKSSPNSCKFLWSSTKTPKRVDEEVGTFLNVFSLRPDKLARSCEITAHVKFIKTQIPNISSFFFFFFKCGNSLRWANLQCHLKDL